MPFSGASTGPAITHLCKDRFTAGNGVAASSPAMDIRGALTTATGVTGMTINKPTGVVAGDVIVVFATNASTAIAITGFTEIHTGLANFEHLLWRTADGTEGSTFTITWAGGGSLAGVCGAWQNGKGGSSFWDPSQPAAPVSAEGTTTAPSVLGLENSASEATTKNGDIVLWLLDGFGTSGTATVGFPSGFAGTSTNVGAGLLAGLAWKKQATAGTVGTLTGSLTGLSGTVWAAQAVALQHNG